MVAAGYSALPASALHRVRQPDVQRELRALSDGAETADAHHGQEPV